MEKMPELKKNRKIQLQESDEDYFTKKDRRINVTISKTINTGNYNSLKVQAGIDENIPEKCDVEAVYSSLWEIAENQVNNAADIIMSENPDKSFDAAFVKKSNRKKKYTKADEVYYS